MRKIKFIKENDLFDWEVGDIRKVEGKYITEQTNMLISKDTNLHADHLVETGYAEWIQETPDLVEKVNQLICGRIIGKAQYTSKYKCLALYDDIVKGMAEYGEGLKTFILVPRDSGAITFFARANDYHVMDRTCRNICEAMLESKKFRPYLNKLFGIDNEK